MLLQQFQNLVGDLPVLFKGLREDEDVVQIDHDHTFQFEVLKDVVHHCLEGGGTVREAEEHDKGLIQAAVGPEGSLPFVWTLLKPHRTSSFMKYLAPQSFAISSRIKGSRYLFFTVMAFNAR